MKNTIVTILQEGGLTLWALLVLAVMIYSLAASVAWNGWQVRRHVKLADWSGASQRREMVRDWTAFELDQLAWVERRLPFLAVLIGAAPLLGLLGTVGGMLVTFSGVAARQGSEPIDMISSGISRALITTQAGLVIAIPAAFLLALLKSQMSDMQRTLEQQLHQRLGASLEQES
ncbi:MAG: MotA/TolQ/ExbB proton channel family protein [Verrucomicrobiales bacterium]